MNRSGTVLPVVLCTALASGCAAPSVSPVQPRPERAGAWVSEADGLRQRGALDEAAELYRKALAQDAGDTRAHVGLQTVELARGRDLSLRREYRSQGDGYLSGRLEGDRKRAREEFDNAAEPWRSYGLAALAHERGDLDNAHGLYTRALRMDPGHVPSRLGLGRVLLAEGHTGAAEAQFRAVLWQEGDHAAALAGLGSVAARRGRRQESLRWLQAACGFAPSDTALVRKLYERAQAGGLQRRRTADVLLRGKGNQGVGPLLAGQLLEALGDRRAAEAAWARATLEGATPAEIVHARTRILSGGLKRFLDALAKGVRARYRHYALTGEAQTFPEFLEWVRGLFERKLDRKLGPAGKPITFSYVGTILDPTSQTDDPLVRACAEEGVLLLIGKRFGGPPEALAAVIDAHERARSVRVRGMDLQREIFWLGHRYLSGFEEWAGGGDLAGLALYRSVLVDRPAVARWEGDLLRRRRLLRQDALEEEALSDSPVRSLDDPAGVAQKLTATGVLDLGEEVLAHEDAHLVDAALHLPVGKHPIRNLVLLVKRRFAGSRILAYLERNAQLTAIVEGSNPRAALATCCQALGGGGAHATGYEEIVEAFVNEIASHPERYPEVDTSRVIVQQLHRLTDAQIRAIARRISERWDVTQ